MNRIQRLRVIPILCVTGSMLFVGIPGQALAQATNRQIPENAEASSYGDGWRCNPGYRESNGACAAIEIPESGFATSLSYGTGWECDRGYRADGDDCVIVEIPENAHLDSGGNDWNCDRPYSKRSDRCVAPSSK